MVESIDNISTDQSIVKGDSQEMMNFISEAEEDLMHMDSQADEAFILANTYYQFEEEKKKQLQASQLKASIPILEEREKSEREHLATLRRLKVKVEKATKLADDPELTVIKCLTSIN